MVAAGEGGEWQGGWGCGECTEWSVGTDAVMWRTGE